MARPKKKCTCLCCKLRSVYFKPGGVSISGLDEVKLAIDELEAIRLADYEGLYQEEAAKRMNISRATFGRIIDVARKKVAEAILQGKALRIGPEENLSGGVK